MFNHVGARTRRMQKVMDDCDKETLEIEFTLVEILP